MVVNRFSTLNGSKVAVELVQDGKRKLLRGIAACCQDPQLGRVLKVTIQEEWGELDFVFQESQWDGEISLGTEHGCDYQICVSTDCVCAR